MGGVGRSELGGIRIKIPKCAYVGLAPFTGGVCFLHKKRRLVSAAWFYADQVNAHPKTLRYMHHDSEVLIAGKQNRIGNGMVACQLNQIGNDQRVNTFLTAVVHYAKP